MATIMAGVALVLMEWFRLGALIKFIPYPVIAMKKFARKDVRLILSGVQPQPMKLLYKSGFIEEIGLENVCANLDEALVRAAALADAVILPAPAAQRAIQAPRLSADGVPRSE